MPLFLCTETYLHVNMRQEKIIVNKNSLKWAIDLSIFIHVYLQILLIFFSVQSFFNLFNICRVKLDVQPIKTNYQPT